MRIKAKSMGVFKVRLIPYDFISVYYIFFDPAILETFYIKHDVGDSNSYVLIIFYAILALTSISVLAISSQFAVVKQRLG